MPKYTAGGLLLLGGQRKYRGWMDAGIGRYNELVGRVKRDRLKRPSFDDKFLEERKEEFAARLGRTARAKTGTALIPKRAVHDLWEDDEAPEESSDNSDTEDEQPDAESRGTYDKAIAATSPTSKRSKLA